MHTACKKPTANLKLINNLIVSPDISSSVSLLTYLITETESIWIEAAIDCLHAVSDGTIGVECRHTNFNLHIKI